MNVGLRVRILRSKAEIEAVRESWARWQQHPHSDLDFFLTIVRTRSEVISPYVIALYRNDILETLLVGRLERSEFTLSVGYWHLLRFPVRALSFVYGGMLGDASGANCAALFEEVRECLKREKALLARFDFVRVGSVMYCAAYRVPRLLSRDYFAETRLHWIMKLPADMGKVYEKMSPKARKTHRQDANRLRKAYSAVRVECYTKEADVDRVMEEAECVARRTYQRALGVGFIANQENRERFTLEASRGRLRAYFLYLGDKPVAFNLATLFRNVLYDNFTAYDPEYGRYSPGTFLFLEIFESLCSEGVEAVDFGVGDAWYKAQFGNVKSEETAISMFSSTLNGLVLNLSQMPAAVLDRLGKRAAVKLRILRSVKKRWRGWARKRMSA